MMNIIVASTNPVKIEATRQGFAHMFPEKVVKVSGISVASGVSDQPMTNAETLRGARNRAQNAQIAQPNADFWVGIEGGVEEVENEMETFAWMVIQEKNMGTTSTGKNSMVGKSKTATFVLPSTITKLIHAGKELGEADDIIFGRTNSKHANGSVGILTNDVINRTTYYSHAIMLALIPFKNAAFYN